MLSSENSLQIAFKEQQSIIWAPFSCRHFSASGVVFSHGGLNFFLACTCSIFFVYLFLDKLCTYIINLRRKFTNLRVQIAHLYTQITKIPTGLHANLLQLKKRQQFYFIYLQQC